MLARMGNTADNAANISELSFEDALRALEEIVRKLESGEAPLDESIALYARGDALRAQCQARLDAAQTRIEAIVADRDGRPTGVRPLDDAAGNGPGALA